MTPTNLGRRHIWNALFIRQKTVYTHPHAGPAGYIGNYTSLLSIAVQKQLERPIQSRLPSPILSFICMIEKAFMTDPSRSEEIIKISQFTSLAPEDSTIGIAQKCCMLAANIHWKAIINTRAPYRTGSNQETQEDVLRLKNAVISSDEEFWFMQGPEVLRWILFIGAAAASSSSHRMWFIVRSFNFCAVISRKMWMPLWMRLIISCPYSVVHAGIEIFLDMLTVNLDMSSSKPPSN